ncbi:MAG: Transmembrane protease serine 12, partial [Paramarteilia canceri]
LFGLGLSSDNGETLVRREDAPFIVRIRIVNSSIEFGICGGTLIGGKWVLTAAHCLYGIDSENVEIIVGDNLLKIRERGEQVIKTNRIIIHPNFSIDRLEADIALIEMEKSPTFNRLVKPLKVAESTNMPPIGTKCNVYGWGNTQNTVNIFLRKFQEQIITPGNNCKSFQVNEDSFCSGWLEDRGICSGDSGGPFICKSSESDEELLFGIVSRAKVCRSASYPDIYVKAGFYNEWIKDEIKEND